MAVNFPSNPTNGQTITVSGITYAYDSTQGVWSDSPQGLTQAIDALTDVDTSTVAPTNGQVLQWNSTDSEWQPADSSAGVTVYATINDLPLSGVAEGSMALVDSTDKLYIFSDSGWYSISIVNTTPSISGVSATYTLATDGTATVVTVTATDPEGLPITYSIVSDTSGNIATVTQGTGANTNQWTITPSTNTANAGSFSLTFRASDGVNIATAVSSFTLVFSVENSKYTTALITSVGANNAVNNSFTDSSTNNHTITASGDVTQGTFSPYRHGGYSGYFDGTGDYLVVTNDTSLELGSSDFTVEAWVYMTSYDSTGFNTFVLKGAGDATNNSYLFDYKNGTTELRFIPYVSDSADLNLVATTTLSLNTWYHVAAVRNGSSWALYKNGVSVATYTASITIDTSTTGLYVGTRGTYGDRFLNGYIADLRVVKGTAVYTSAFTPPTERLTAVANTSLLTCHLPYIADGSTNNHAITVAGNTKTEPFAPYDYRTYASSDHGGSMYFDGTGDALEISDNADFDLSGGSWTIECWWYPLVVNTYDSIFNQWNGATAASGRNINVAWESNRLYLFGYDGGTVPPIYHDVTAAQLQNRWNHVAAVFDGTKTELYLNGKASGRAYVSPNNLSKDIASEPFRVAKHHRLTSYYYSNSCVSDLRLVKGTAVYSGAFTPPTGPLTTTGGTYPSTTNVNTSITAGHTKLHIKGTNAGIIDKSQSVKAVTLVGTAKSSTTQTKYLSSSMYFDGTGDYISTPSDFFNFGIEDFTVECWFYANSLDATAYTCLFGVHSGNSDEWGTYVRTVGVGIYGASNTLPEGGTVNTSTWYHFAVTRSGTTVKVFLDGTQVATQTTSNSYSSSASPFRIGADNWTNLDFNGYMSDVRITKGLARYTANFTPPSAALQG